MKNVFDEATNKKLLAATTKAEVSAILAEVPGADRYMDKVDLIMNEIEMVNGIADDELLSDDEIEHVAGGAKRSDIYLSETTSCVATFFLADQVANLFCWSNDQCGVSNEYKYHYTKYSNCKHGGRHEWVDGKYEFSSVHNSTKLLDGHMCAKCGLKIATNTERYND